MLLRLQAENIFSFGDVVEFNTFTSSKSHSHDWHKISCGPATVLRMSAIYGANGAGKSNLVKCVALLQQMVKEGNLETLSSYDDLYFKLNSDGKSKPSELALEFYTGGHTFYYHLAFDKEEVYQEDLFLDQKSKEKCIFTRKGNDVKLYADFLKDIGKDEGFYEQFLDAMSRIIRSDMLALSFFGRYYSKELPIIKVAMDWILSIQLVLPTSKINLLPQALDVDKNFANLVNLLMPELKTGISELAVRKEKIDEAEMVNNSDNRKLLSMVKAKEGKATACNLDGRKELGNLVMEDGQLFFKTIYAVHIDSAGNKVEMSMDAESDGTRKLVEYMTIIYLILKSNTVYVVDEIERSIHPIVIKSIIRKISESNEAKGQIIFTTHESCLLDQSIFRPDEIWFAQKDSNQSTQLYPLSDYNIHHTANIENGYLNGRYGGIPFLSNLSDLKW